MTPFDHHLQNQSEYSLSYHFHGEANQVAWGNYQGGGLRYFSPLQDAISVSSHQTCYQLSASGNLHLLLLLWGFHTPSFSLPSPNNLILVRLSMILDFTLLQHEVKIAFQIEAYSTTGNYVNFLLSFE